MHFGISLSSTKVLQVDGPMVTCTPPVRNIIQGRKMFCGIKLQLSGHRILREAIGHSAPLIKLRAIRLIDTDLQPSGLGYIMGDAMTVAAFCELFMDYGAVGLTMAILARGNLTVLRMAFHAGKGRMLCHIIFQQLIRLLMTAGADLFGFRNRIRDVQRSMHRMAG